MKGKGIGSKSSKTRPGDTAGRRDVRQGSSRDQEKAGKPSEPFKMSLPKRSEKIKLTLNTAKTTTKPNTAVLEKLGMANEDLAEARKAAKRKAELEKVEALAAAKRAKAENSNVLMETLKERLKKKIDAGNAKAASGEKSKAAPVLGDVAAKGVRKVKEVKEGPAKGKEKEEGPDAKGRREELLKQLKAVEDAIHRKRTKLDG